MDDTREAFVAHDAYDRDGDGFSLSTTPFEARIVGEGSDYELQISMPTLDGATEETVESVVEDGWFETLSLRVDDAPDATRIAVSEPTVERVDDTVTVAFGFTHDDPDDAAKAAKILAEFVEGTYIEGVVPGYTYRPPVAGLLSQARQQGDGGSDGENEGESGPMPL